MYYIYILYIILECSRRYPSTNRFVALFVQLHLQKFCILLVAPGRYVALTFCCICRSFVQFWGSWHGRGNDVQLQTKAVLEVHMKLRLHWKLLCQGAAN